MKSDRRSRRPLVAGDVRQRLAAHREQMRGNLVRDGDDLALEANGRGEAECRAAPSLRARIALRSDAAAGLGAESNEGRSSPDQSPWCHGSARLTLGCGGEGGIAMGIAQRIAELLHELRCAQAN